jgi:hypothetical protein
MFGSVCWNHVSRIALLSLGHFGQGLCQLFLGVKDVPEFIDQQFIQTVGRGWR